MFQFNQEHILFRQTLRDFLKKEAVPFIDKWEEQGFVDRMIFHKMGEMGFLGTTVPEAYGGEGLDFSYQVIMAEELSKLNSGGFGAAILAHVSLAMVYLERFASDDLKSRYLPNSCVGIKIGCLAVTEPHAGSDVQGIKTKATKVDGGFVINGSKTFITNGVSSDYLVVAAKTETDFPNSIGLFVMDRDSAGVKATNLNKLGWRASDTGEIALHEVFVPEENLIGEEMAGFYYIMQNFALERLILAVAAIAACDDALSYTLQYMNDRTAFGRKINKFQVLRHRVAQLASEIERARVFNYSTLKMLLDGEAVVKECAMAKLLSTELSDKVMTECLQCLGGYGFMEDYRLARMFRDSRLGTIGGGTSEIMRDLIAKMVIDEINYQ